MDNIGNNYIEINQSPYELCMGIERILRDIFRIYYEKGLKDGRILVYCLWDDHDSDKKDDINEISLKVVPIIDKTVKNIDIYHVNENAFKVFVRYIYDEMIRMCDYENINCLYTWTDYIDMYNGDMEKYRRDFVDIIRTCIMESYSSSLFKTRNDFKKDLMVRLNCVPEKNIWISGFGYILDKSENYNDIWYLDVNDFRVGDIRFQIRFYDKDKIEIEEV